MKIIETDPNLQHSEVEEKEVLKGQELLVGLEEIETDQPLQDSIKPIQQAKQKN